MDKQGSNEIVLKVTSEIILRECADMLRRCNALQEKVKAVTCKYPIRRRAEPADNQQQVRTVTSSDLLFSSLRYLSRL